MRAMGRFLVLATVSALLSACGGSSSGKSQQVQIPDPPAAPAVSVEGDIKQLMFSWDNVSDADYYRLLENADGHSGYTQVGANIPTSTLSATRSIAVHRHDWVNALYMVQACNMGGCAGSPEVSATDVMLDTIGYFKASNTEAEDVFGFPVALSADGNTLAVGAVYEKSSATGINGDQADNSLEQAGAVYLFRYDGTTWAQQAYIKASNTERGDRFGWSAIALSADGNTLAVGAFLEQSSATGINGDQADNSSNTSGAVYLFRYDGTSWAQQAYIKASNTEAGDQFGHAVALSTDGNTLAIGAYLEDSGATGINGDQTDNSARNSGAAYLFRFDGMSWAQQAYIKASNPKRQDLFGRAVALNADGNTLAVGAENEQYVGAVYLFRFDGTSWSQQSHIKASNEADIELVGVTIALSADGNTLAAGAWEDGGRFEMSLGAVYVFRFDGTSWLQQANIKGSNTEDIDFFGMAIAISADGNTLAVGARSEDSGATGINGDQADDLVRGAGAAYLFRFNGHTWLQQPYTKASNTAGGDAFGYSVGLSADGDTLAVGAPGEDSGATGINGDQADDSESSAGAVYVY